MCRIYENCTINISADHSEDAEAGCFTYRDTDHVKSCILEQEDGDETELTALCDIPFWSDQALRCPLMQRAWVHQERLLAPRILRFGWYQMFWECADLCACETFPLGCPTGKEAPTSLSKSVPKEEDRWEHIVKAFSRARLTNPEDRLPAIGGIAERISHLRNTAYWAGFFQDSLPAALLWERTMESFVVKPVKPYIAPTWSWASCEGEIDFHHRRWWHNHLEALCRVNEITLTYVSATNKFGQLRHAALILTGPIFHVTHIDEEDEFLHGDTWSNETHGYPVLNEPEGDAGKLQGRMKLRRMHAVFDETPAIQSRKDLSYLIILARTAPRGPFSWKSHCGLILKPAGDESNPNHFVRIGIFTVEDDGHAPTDRAHYKMFTVTLV